MNKNILIIILFCNSLLIPPLFGGLLQNTFEGVRPMGMGNAFIALSDDANAVWYNPAGLADIEGVHVNVFNFILGVDSKDTLDRIGNAIFKGDSDHLIGEGKKFVRFNFMPNIVIPHFGISIFSQTKGNFDTSDLTNQGLDVHAHHDQGAIAGGAVSISDYFSVGASLRAFYRAGIDLTLTPSEIIAQYGANAANLMDDIYTELSSRAGHGYAFGLNAGIKLKIPLPTKNRFSPYFYLAATAEDIGNTTFKAIGSQLPPTSIKQSFNFGGAIVYPFGKNWKWNLTTDIKHALEPTDFIRQFHLGTELRHSIFGIRAGANQGYLTYGFSFEFPPHTKVHFSSYGVELGNRRWEKEQRTYLLQLNIGFNPI